MGAIERRGNIMSCDEQIAYEERSVPNEQPKMIEGELLARDLRFAFVAARSSTISWSNR